jgi:hypothetical protein
LNTHSFGKARLHHSVKYEPRKPIPSLRTFTTNSPQQPSRRVQDASRSDTAITSSTLVHQQPMGLEIHTPTPSALPTFQPTPPEDTRPSLPSIGLSISRPSSRVSTASTRSLSSSYYSQAQSNVQLPALSALAHLATAQTPPPEHNYKNGYVSRQITRAYLGFSRVQSGTKLLHVFVGINPFHLKPCTLSPFAEKDTTYSL